jgi:hypothetical protein
MQSCATSQGEPAGRCSEFGSGCAGLDNVTGYGPDSLTICNLK